MQNTLKLISCVFTRGFVGHHPFSNLPLFQFFFLSVFRSTFGCVKMTNLITVTETFQISICLCTFPVCRMLYCLSCYSWVISLCCGNESIHIFIHFSMCPNNAVTCRATSKLPHTQFSFYFWWYYRTQAEDNDTTEHSFCIFYLISAPLRGSSLTSNRVFVYCREGKWQT